MAGSDLHMAMAILSSEALMEQSSLLEDVRIAIGKVIALEESPAGMRSLASEYSQQASLALVSARLRGWLESLLSRQRRSKTWYGARDRELSDLLSDLLWLYEKIASSAYIAGVTSGDTTTRQSTTVDELAKPRGDEGAGKASTSAPTPAIALKQDQPVSTDQDLGFLNSSVSITEQKQRWANPTHVDKRLTKLEVLKKMVRILLADRIDVDEEGPLFLPLAGGPASGKTLLAHTLFNDAGVVEKFGLRVWVHVSQRFDSSRILREILSVALTGGYIFENQAILHQKSHVWEALSNRRYLIVFDDAWSENVQEWDTLMEHLPSNGTVILTCRIPAVVSCFATVKPHLKAINKKLQFKFVHLWEVIRRDIQVALTKKLIEGRTYQVNGITRRAEEQIRYNEFVLQKARASYFNLPPDLRKCLLYCSVFPWGHKFHPEELADVFVAEGGISPAMTQAQRIGFVQKLFDECFYPVDEHDSTTGKRTYCMYAVMHEFAKIVEVLPNRIASYFEMSGNGYESTALERTYWMHGIGHIVQRRRHMLANIVQRRRLMTSETMDEKDLNAILRHRKVLFLQGTNISRRLHKFDKMTNLRYLNLSRTDIERIPSFMKKLQFLQTLILSHCQKLQILDDTTSMLVQLQKLDLEGCCYLMELPPGILKMKSLRFLNVHGCSSLTRMPYGMGQLTNLETMLGHIVSNNGGAISELQPLVNLKILSLEGLENISDVADARDVKLDEKDYLESLAFRWNKSADSSKSSSVAQILECLRPNQNLKELEIIGYEGIDHPSWMASTNPYLISLVVIRLVGLKKCETLPPLGLLPLLKIFDISRAETISSISDSFYGSSGTFPSLEKLTFSYMSNLELWEQPHGGAVFPCLAEVTIIQCPKLALCVELPSVTKLILWMNNKMIYSSEGALGTVAQNLKHVSISFSQELISSSLCEGLQGLCRLKRLELCGCDEMNNLPCGLQHLSSLKSLTIMHCIKLETLPDWLGNLSSLTLLRLYSCPMLYSIPEVLRLRPCTHISIKDCPKLPAQPLETAFEGYDNDIAGKIFADIITVDKGHKAFTGKFDKMKSKDEKSMKSKETAFEGYDNIFADINTGDKAFIGMFDKVKSKDEKSMKSKGGKSVRFQESKDFGDNEPATCEIDTDIYSIVMNTPGFTEEQLMCALSHLLDNEAIGKTFMDLPESERVTWIIDFLKKHFRP